MGSRSFAPGWPGAHSFKGDNVNKAELVLALENTLGSRKAATDALDAVLDSIVREVAKGGKVAITGFGTFQKVARAARTGRNPRTGAAVRIKKTTVPRFRPGTAFKGYVADPRSLPKGETATGRAPAAKAAPAKAAPAKAAPAKAAPAKATAAKTAPAKATAAKTAPAKAATPRRAPVRKTAATPARPTRAAVKRAVTPAAPAAPAAPVAPAAPAADATPTA